MNPKGTKENNKRGGEFQDPHKESLSLAIFKL